MAAKIHAIEVEDFVEQQMLLRHGPATSLDEFATQKKELTEKLWNELEQAKKSDYFTKAHAKINDRSSKVRDTTSKPVTSAEVVTEADKTGDEELRKSDEPANDDE